jgi:hypothetical protein
MELGPSLNTVIFEPNSQLHTIESYAFLGCRHLTSITLPASLANVSGSSFSRGRLAAIAIDAENETLFARDPFLMERQRPWIVRYFGTSASVSIPDDIEGFSDGVFEFCPIGGVMFGPDSKLMTIACNAFRDCSRLSSIIIPSFVTVLGPNSFHGCRLLQTVSFAPNSRLASIEQLAFRECSVLDSLALPSSVKNLGDGCFSHCCALREFALLPDSKLTRMGQLAFEGCFDLQSLFLPSSVEFVGAQCFEDSITDFSFSSPCRVRTLLDLPPLWEGCHDIPDSVEILSCARVRGRFFRRSERALVFGRESRLTQIRGELPALGPGMLDTFVQVSSRSLKAFRANLEFDERPKTLFSGAESD